MLEVSDGFKSAIVGDTRRMFTKAIIDIVDPDIVYGVSDGSGVAPWAKPAQLHDKEFTLKRYATLEPKLWALDGSYDLIPDVPQEITGEVGHVGNVFSGTDGSFPVPVYAELKFSGVSILQACSVFFGDQDTGYGVDFTVDIYSNGAVIHSQQFKDNKKPSVSVKKFKVFDPDKIRVSVTKWSKPGRRIRIAEIIPGVYEQWTDSMLASVDISMAGNFACLALPYGTCTLVLNNTDRRFEPYAKDGIFESIEERQTIPVQMGVQTDSGVEYVPVGVFYQKSGGWTTGANEMTITWNLVDICGLLADRAYIPSGSLPTTLSGWIAELAGQLGVNFRKKWHVDPNYANKPCRVNSQADLNNMTCGQILRYVCMATGTWPRADQKTGDLTAEPFWNQGVKLNNRQMSKYPVKKANDELAALIFKLYDGGEEEKKFVVSGNSTTSSKTISINNPFIHSEAEALTASKQILSQYGGITLDVLSRGNPSAEVGDVETVDISRSEGKVGRVMEQALSIRGGVLKDCTSHLLQADGSFLFSEKAVVKKNGKFHVPSGVSQVRLILVGGGARGGRGGDGTVHPTGNIPGGGAGGEAGEPGTPGAGGLIWSGVVNVNPDTDYDVSVAGPGGATTFGVYSSENGKRYVPSFTDIASGDCYGRTGVDDPKPGSGDGGAGGAGGTAGAGHWNGLYKWYENENGEWVEDPNWQTGWEFIVDVEPGEGQSGVGGAGGSCVIWWEKEAV